MDLAFTPDELAFREEIRAWVKANLPSEISQKVHSCLLYTSPSPRDRQKSRMPSSA